VQGGLQGTIAVGIFVVCGSSSDGMGLNTIDWVGTADVRAGVLVSFPQSVPLDQTGTFPVVITLTQAAPNDAGAITWVTPAGACSVTISGSVCNTHQITTKTGSVERSARYVGGTGTCSQPAAHQSGPSAEPVTIGSFQFFASTGF
jgi:hypothetical protein